MTPPPTGVFGRVQQMVPPPTGVLEGVRQCHRTPDRTPVRFRWTHLWSNGTRCDFIFYSLFPICWYRVTNSGRIGKFWGSRRDYRVLFSKKRKKKRRKSWWWSKDGVQEKDFTLLYHQLYVNLPDPIVFLPVTVDTSDRIYDVFSRLLFLLVHRETSGLTNEMPEESGQFRFLRDVFSVNIKGSMGLILTKVSTIRISMSFDSSSRSCIPLPRSF